MNPREQEDAAFDKLASAQLRRLEPLLDKFSELECDLLGDVLNITLADGAKIIINRHRAARQIWMAAQRRAWHFDYDAKSASWRTRDAELISTLEQVLSDALKRPVTLSSS